MRYRAFQRQQYCSNRAIALLAFVCFPTACRAESSYESRELMRRAMTRLEKSFENELEHELDAETNLDSDTEGLDEKSDLDLNAQTPQIHHRHKKTKVSRTLSSPSRRRGSNAQDAWEADSLLPSDEWMDNLEASSRKQDDSRELGAFVEDDNTEGEDRTATQQHFLDPEKKLDAESELEEQDAEEQLLRTSGLEVPAGAAHPPKHAVSKSEHMVLHKSQPIESERDQKLRHAAELVQQAEELVYEAAGQKGVGIPASILQKRDRSGSIDKDKLPLVPRQRKVTKKGFRTTSTKHKKLKADDLVGWAREQSIEAEKENEEAEQIQQEAGRSIIEVITPAPTPRPVSSEILEDQHLSAMEKQEDQEARHMNEEAARIMKEWNLSESSLHMEKELKLLSQAPAAEVESEDLNIQMCSANQRLCSGDALELYRLAHVVGDLLDRHNLSWWATGGTLLGVVRNRGVIPHDDDVDYNILDKQSPALQSPGFQKDLQNNGLSLRKIHDEFWKVLKKNSTGPNGAYLSVDLFAMGQDDASAELRQALGESAAATSVLQSQFGPYHYRHGWWPKHTFPESLCTMSKEKTNDDVQKFFCPKLKKWRFGASWVWAPEESISLTYLDTVYGGRDSWKKKAACVGTNHRCRLVTNITHDTTAPAEPAGPLIDAL